MLGHRNASNAKHMGTVRAIARPTRAALSVLTRTIPRTTQGISELHDGVSTALRCMSLKNARKPRTLAPPTYLSVPMVHSAQAAQCPIRRAKVAPRGSKEYFQVTKTNAKTHAAR